MKPGLVGSQYKTAPSASVSFPPADYALTHYLVPGDNWSSLAEQYKRNDVWDLIYFNFRTYDPKVANHCMETLLGCNHTTDDGKNYTFHGANPGKLYVPHQDWAPGDGGVWSAEDVQMRDKVLNVLSSPYVKNVKFVNPMNGVTSPAQFAAVASKVMSHEIRVRFVGAHGDAEYDPQQNVIKLDDKDAYYSFPRSRILHECLHAAHDLERRPVTGIHSECDCYIAQMMYLLHQPEYADLPPKVKGATSLIGTAYAIARKLLGRPVLWSALPSGPSAYKESAVHAGYKEVYAGDYRALAQAVYAHPHYDDPANLRLAGFNGV